MDSSTLGSTRHTTRKTLQHRIHRSHTAQNRSICVLSLSSPVSAVCQCHGHIFATRQATQRKVHYYTTWLLSSFENGRWQWIRTVFSCTCSSHVRSLLYCPGLGDGVRFADGLKKQSWKRLVSVQILVLSSCVQTPQCSLCHMHNGTDRSHSWS